jgi:hypothetical protein
MRGTRFTKTLTVVTFVFALFAALSLPGSTADADDSGVEIGATGGSVYPIRETNIRMAAETVQAVCFGSFAEYRVDFRFVNEGKTRTVKLGFPFTDTISTGEGSPRPVGFEAWQNGRPLAVKTVAAKYTDGKATAGYFLHQAVFPHGATMITVSYLAQVSGQQLSRIGVTNDYPGIYKNYYQYWLHTGSTWSGPIGKAVVRFQFADSFRGTDIVPSPEVAAKYPPLTAPPGWTTPLPNTYQWQFSDFEPTPTGAGGWWKPSKFDVTLGFTDNGPWPWVRTTWVRSSTAAGFRSLNAYDATLSSCWAEGAPGLGIGEWIQARFRHPTRLRELRILPGNNAYGSAFTMFARPKTLKAVFSDGSSTLLHLTDSPTLQRFPVEVTTRSVKFVIESAYKGTDYPATCISEVEFGAEPAPRYAPFADLIVDPWATGRLAAQAGPPAPTPKINTASDWQVAQDYMWYTGGDLMGISGFDEIGDNDKALFPADVAPFKQPSTLAQLTARAPGLGLPDAKLVGDVTEVNALSYWTYEVRYSSGIDLLVNTRLAAGPRTSLFAALKQQGENMPDYEDGRVLPFAIVKIGEQRLGSAEAGIVPEVGGGFYGHKTKVPAQVFWRAGDQSYHLYARSDSVTADTLLAVAGSMIAPPVDTGSQPVAEQRQASSFASSWWLVLGAAAATVFAAALALAILRRRRAAPPADTK